MHTLNHIRSEFLDFFKQNNHTIVPSAPLVPHNDPTLLFTAAGMVPFKDVFTGKEKRPYTRATSSQKCVRAGGKHNDLDQVGYTARHHTFFEMLGNFSFGDYFKEEAIAWAFEFLTKNLQLPKDKLVITVYHTDDESHKIWGKFVSESRIIRIDTNDNFWSMGDTGPCGPCTEIFYDYGDSVAGGPPGSADADGDRFVEIWNLVLMQYDQQSDGTRLNLPKPCIDTGMGLERIGSVMQGKTNNFETDVMRAIVDASRATLNADGPISSHRVIADHIRTTAFLIADGILPSNEGRGYVLRRILRRAMRHAHILGAHEPVLHHILPSLNQTMGDAYPELLRATPIILNTLEQEETKFIDLLDRGLSLIDDVTKHIPINGTLAGDVAFKLYDTYGFPIDLTADALREKNMNVDLEGFEQAMKAQKDASRAAWAGSGESSNDHTWQHLKPTEFLGYQQLTCEATILDIHHTNSQSQIVVDQTPCYATSGGQIADHGTMTLNNNQMRIIDVIKTSSNQFVHIVEGTSEWKAGDRVVISVDETRRSMIAAHHSATHLLHHTLRHVLGEHVTQKGSLVDPKRLRFDFTHPKALTVDEKRTIERLINQMILKSDAAQTDVQSPEDAFKSGAIGLFGEKYGDHVRVVILGDSKELCGGTHVQSTGQIGLCKIISESSVASGIRRIEAVCGLALLDHIETVDAEWRTKEENWKNNQKKETKKVESSFQTHCITSGKIPLYVEEGNDLAVFKGRIDVLRPTHLAHILFIYNIQDAKISFVISTPKDSNLDSAMIAKHISTLLDGKGGGGRSDLAQGGGTSTNKLNDIWAYLQNI